MFQVKVHPKRQLLAIAFSERVDVGQMRDCQEQVGKLLGGLRPGFVVLTDLTALEVMEPECLPIIKEMMDLCNAQGASAVVRVIPEPDKDIGFSVATLFHYDAGVTIVTCRSLVEAEGFLPSAAGS